MMPAHAQRLLLQAARSFPSLPFAGQGDSGALGTTFDFHPEFWVFAEITEQPSRDEEDEESDFPGYSWEQRIPQPDGEWAEPDPDTEGGLSGDNGSTTGEIRSPAFALDGDESIAAGTIVVLVRGYQHDGGETDEGKGQEWLILGPAGDSGRTARVHVTGRPILAGTIRLYPGFLDLDDTDGLGFHDGDDPIWIMQRDNATLDTRGDGYYEARRKPRRYTADNCGEPDERYVYVVTSPGRNVVVDGPAGCQFKYSGRYEGEDTCDLFTVGGEVMLIGGEGMRI
jgi:hypothetical protein